MANISTEKIHLKTGTQFQKIVKYSKGVFSIELPAELCVDMIYKNKEDQTISATSEVAVNDLFKEKLKEWDKAVSQIHKVILFEAKFQGALAKKTFLHRWENGYTPSYPEQGISKDASLWEFNKDDLHSTYDLGLMFKWAVYSKKQFKDKRDYKFISGRPFGSFMYRNEMSSGVVEIEHTPDRERFFKELDESFATMIAKVYKALGDLTPEKLTALTESGLKLLTN